MEGVVVLKEKNSNDLDLNNTVNKLDHETCTEPLKNTQQIFEEPVGM